MDELIRTSLILLRAQVIRARDALDTRRRGQDLDAGVSTLEMVIIALGLMAVAGLLVAAVTAAVTRRTEQIE